MHEQIESFLDVIRKQIEDTAVKYFDRYVEQMAEQLEAFKESGGTPPDQPMLHSEFQGIVRDMIRGGAGYIEGDAMIKLARKVASNQIGFAIQDYLNAAE